MGSGGLGCLNMSPIPVNNAFGDQYNYGSQMAGDENGSPIMLDLNTTSMHF